MENNYYTPEISELFIGYECEVTYKGWVLYELDADFISRYATNLENEWTLGQQIRTPYLCKQDIIDLGFKESAYKHPFLGVIESYEKEIGYNGFKGFGEYGIFRIVKHPKSQIIEIHKIYESSWGSQHEQIFSGLCKSKNELKKLMKDYLNIPI